VTVNGTNLSSVTEVKINDTIASPITPVSATSLKVNVPTGATTGKISVTNRAGTALSALAFKVIPKINSVTPTSALPGEATVITGLNFTGATAVRFGAVTATQVTVDSDAQITATVPATAVTGRVSVVTASGTGISTTDF